ncbi:MAG TPA: NIL domain-containing protein [Actinomycetota bacterium]|nr:NIL domain-containing protein [Actinomycetota bacterium]
MAKRRLHLTFPENLITEPVIFNLGKNFNVVTNIRRANVEETVGWVILELDGDPEEIDKAVAYATELGLQVGAIDGDVSA